MAVFRVKDDGSGIEMFSKYCLFTDGMSYYDGFPEDYVFDPAVGLSFGVRTDILGTFIVFGRFTVTANGIEIISDMYEYPDLHGEYVVGRVTLERELTLTLLDAELNEVREVTLPVGTVIFQRYTDLESWVIVETEDGTMYKASVRIVSTDDEWGIYINGINQEELGMLAYAD